MNLPSTYSLTITPRGPLDAALLRHNASFHC